MTGHTATFSNGKTTITKRRLAYTHAWHASGKLVTGTDWQMHGFSISGAAGARKAMLSITAHLRVGGGTMEFQEIVEATQVPA